MPRRSSDGGGPALGSKRLLRARMHPIVLLLVPLLLRGCRDGDADVSPVSLRKRFGGFRSYESLPGDWLCGDAVVG